MFKCLPVAMLGVVMFSCGSVEAQLFRRFAVPRPPAVQPAVPNCGAGQARPNAVQPQPHYRRVQVAPRRFAIVPAQSNGATNQFQQQAVTPQRPSVAPVPQANSVVTRKAPVEPVASPSGGEQTQQRYRRVAVYNPRTGQRSVRLIPIPSSTLAQQSYVYGQQGAGQGAPNPQVVTGTFVSPGQNPQLQNSPAQARSVVDSSNEIRLDSQVQPATFEEPSVTLNQPQGASTIPVPPEPQPAITPSLDQPDSRAAGDSSGQHSVLVFEDETSEDPAAEIRLELDAPAN